MKAIILAGGQDTGLLPLTKNCVKSMLPVVNRPALEYVINYLKSFGIREMVITSNGQSKIYSGYFGEGRAFGVEIHYSKENYPRGTAGSLKDIEEFIDEDPFLVINSSLFLDFNLSALIKFHTERNAVATVGVAGKDCYAEPLESIEIFPDLQVKSIHRINSATDRRYPLKPLGIYLFDFRIFDLIGEKGYIDIKEQLFPKLKEQDFPVCVYKINGYHKMLRSIKDYYEINRDMLNGYCWNSIGAKTEIADLVWVEGNVVIADEVNLIGPIVIGEDSVIEKGVQIIGPTVIGKNCLISEGSTIRESLIWTNSVLESYTRVDYTIVGDRSLVPKFEVLENAIVVDDRFSIGDLNLASQEFIVKTAAFPSLLAANNLTDKILKKMYSLFF